MKSPGNLLLQWVSETGVGQLRDLLDAVTWTARAYDVKTTKGAAGRWIRYASAMGFLDVDWMEGRWSAAPPVLTRIPDADGLLLLTGSRTATIADRLRAAQDSDIEAVIVENRTSADDVPCPDTIFICDDRDLDTSDLARRLGAYWVPRFAEQMIDLILPLVLGGDAAAPSHSAALEWFDLGQKKFIEVSKPAEEGLYRFQRADHKRPYQILRRGRWFQTAYEEGVFLELAYRSKGNPEHIRWTPEKAVGRTEMGRLVIDWGTPLPPLQARMATLCTGLAPLFISVSDFGFTKYDNVPYEVAKAIATSLHQTLSIFGANGE